MAKTVADQFDSPNGLTDTVREWLHINTKRSRRSQQGLRRL
jgi:hypothetical protein